MIDSLFWWTGAIAWGVIGSMLLWLIIEMLIAVVAAASWVRWSLATMRARSINPRWCGLPFTFFSMWLELVGHRNSKTKCGCEWRNSGGVWSGIGDWAVYSQVKNIANAEDTTRDRHLWID